MKDVWYRPFCSLSSYSLRFSVSRSKGWERQKENQREMKGGFDRDRQSWFILRTSECFLRTDFWRSFTTQYTANSFKTPFWRDVCLKLNLHSSQSMIYTHQYFTLLILTHVLRSWSSAGRFITCVNSSLWDWMMWDYISLSIIPHPH